MLLVLQACAGRPIPVLPQHTFPGNVILSSRATSGLSPPVQPDPELEKLCLAHITNAAKNVFAVLDSLPEKGGNFRGEDDEQDNFVGEPRFCCRGPLFPLLRTSQFEGRIPICFIMSHH